MSNKTCPSCGSVFNCEGDRDCWCEGRQIHRVQMIEIMERFSDCICPGCLKRYEAKE